MSNIEMRQINKRLYSKLVENKEKNAKIKLEKVSKNLEKSRDYSRVK